MPERPIGAYSMQASSGQCPPMKARALTVQDSSRRSVGGISAVITALNRRAVSAGMEMWDLRATFMHSRMESPRHKGLLPQRAIERATATSRTSTTAACSIGLSAWVNAIQHKPFEAVLRVAAGDTVAVNQLGYTCTWLRPACLAA